MYLNTKLSSHTVLTCLTTRLKANNFLSPLVQTFEMMILLLWLYIWSIKCNLLLRCMEKLLKMLMRHKSNKNGHMVHGKVNKCFLDSRKKKPMWKWRSMGKRSPWHLTRKDLSYSWNILMVMVTLIRMKKEGSVWLKAKNSSSRTDSGGINKYFMLHLVKCEEWGTQSKFWRKHYICCMDLGLCWPLLWPIFLCCTIKLPYIFSVITHRSALWFASTASRNYYGFIKLHKVKD